MFVIETEMRDVSTRKFEFLQDFFKYSEANASGYLKKSDIYN